VWDDLEEHIPEQKPGYGQYPSKQGGYGNQQGFQKKPWNGGGFQKKPMRKMWQEKDIDVSNTSIYMPCSLAFNNDAPDLGDVYDQIIDKLNQHKFTVRLGVNGPATEKFEKGIQQTELILPWKGFNERESKFTFNPDEAYYVAKLYQPNYESIKDGAKIFLATNVRLIMGQKLNSPTLFLITWSQDGCEHARDRSIKTGNVGHVIAIATALRLPIFNLARPDALQRLLSYIED